MSQALVEDFNVPATASVFTEIPKIPVISEVHPTEVLSYRECPLTLGFFLS